MPELPDAVLRAQNGPRLGGGARLGAGDVLLGARPDALAHGGDPHQFQGAGALLPAHGEVGRGVEEVPVGALDFQQVHHDGVPQFFQRGLLVVAGDDDVGAVDVHAEVLQQVLADAGGDFGPVLGVQVAGVGEVAGVGVRGGHLDVRAGGDALAHAHCDVTVGRVGAADGHARLRGLGAARAGLGEDGRVERPLGTADGGLRNVHLHVGDADVLVGRQGAQDAVAEGEPTGQTGRLRRLDRGQCALRRGRGSRLGARERAPRAGQGEAQDKVWASGLAVAHGLRSLGSARPGRSGDGRLT